MVAPGNALSLLFVSKKLRLRRWVLLPLRPNGIESYWTISVWSCGQHDPSNNVGSCP